MDISSSTPQVECARPPTKQKVLGYRRKRAAIACVACRRRKVRCDVAEHGLPCCNCELDQTECNIQSSRRKRFKPCYRQIDSPSKYPNHMPPTPPQSLIIPSTDEMPNSSAQQARLNQTNEPENNSIIETSPCTSNDLDGPDDPDWLRWLRFLPPGDATKFEMPFYNMHCPNCSTPCYQKFNDTLDGIRNTVELLYEAMAIPAQIVKSSQEIIPLINSLRNDLPDSAQNVETQELGDNVLSDSSLISELISSGGDSISSLSAGSPSIYIGSDNLDAFVGDTQGPEDIMEPT